MALKLPERMKIAKFLEDVTTDVGENRAYMPGWTDVNVGAEFGVSACVVRNIRLSIYPNFVRMSTTAPKNDVAIADLAARLSELEQRISILERAQPASPNQQAPAQRALNLERKPVNRWDQ